MKKIIQASLAAAGLLILMPAAVFGTGKSLHLPQSEEVMGTAYLRQTVHAEKDHDSLLTKSALLKKGEEVEVLELREDGTARIQNGDGIWIVETKALSEKDPDEEVFPEWDGPVLTASAGAIQGPSGKETYYNLDMSGVVNVMRNIGNTDDYWIREDGAKMLGDYVMVAANFNLRPRGSYVMTSLGMGIVCDTGGFASHNPTQIDIATAW